VEARRDVSEWVWVRPPPRACFVLDMREILSPRGEFASVRGCVWRVEVGGYVCGGLDG
jgi:hypothetical protein